MKTIYLYVACLMFLLCFDQRMGICHCSAGNVERLWWAEKKFRPLIKIGPDIVYVLMDNWFDRAIRNTAISAIEFRWAFYAKIESENESVDIQLDPGWRPSRILVIARTESNGYCCEELQKTHVSLFLNDSYWRQSGCSKMAQFLLRAPLVDT